MYYKEVFLFDGKRPVKCIVRNYREADFPELINIQKESFPPPFPSELWWNTEQLINHVSLFPEGTLCVEVGGIIAGSMTGVVVHYSSYTSHTWEKITDSGYIRNHDKDGDTLYVVDICVRPAYRKLGVGKLLMQSMYDVVLHMGLQRLLGGSRMPGYHRVCDKLSATGYLDAVLNGELTDPVVTFLLHCGRMPVKVVPDYLEDEESCNYSVLMEWRNPIYSSSLVTNGK